MTQLVQSESVSGLWLRILARRPALEAGVAEVDDRVCGLPGVCPQPEHPVHVFLPCLQENSS